MMNKTATPEHAPARALSPMTRFVLAVAAGVGVELALGPWVGDPHVRFLASWDVAVFVFIALAWAVVRSFDSRATRARAQMYDQSGSVLFLIVVAAAYASLLAITWGLQEVRALHGTERALRVVLAMLALGGSWLLIHTVFAFHYARVYYRPERGADEHARGLRFPGGTEPDYMDFLYYACVIGMTSQVADVAVTNHHMRRLTLVHGVASFAFNLIILALGINLVAGAIQ